MARAIGACGALDIRSAAILEDLTFAQNPCAAGSTQTRRQRYYGSEFFRDLPEDSDIRNPEKFDRKKDWIHCACASFICMIILGILHSIGLLLPHVRAAYKMGPLHVTVISAATYSIVFAFSPMAAAIVRCMGNRLTCIFGLLLFFIGLVLDALEINLIVYYIAHMGLMGFGGCFALTAAASSVMRHFRKRLMVALAVVIIAAPVGTLVFHLLLYVFAVDTTLGYKWIVLTLAVFVIVSVALTHPLPSSVRPPKHPNPFAFKKRSKIVKECLAKVGQDEEAGGQGHRGGQDEEARGQEHRRGQAQKEEYCCSATNLQSIASQAGPTTNGNQVEQTPPTNPSTNENEEEEEHNKCLCVCVFDISAVTDLSFLLWAVVSSCAVVALYVPYLFLILYAMSDFAVKIFDGLCIILALCLTSAASRTYVLTCGNHTFFFNRTMFQAGCMGSGIIFVLLPQATSYGGLLIWGLVTGVLEGLIVGTIPRVTLLTVPRRYMSCSWSYLVFFNGFALIIGPYLMVSVKQATGGDIGLACFAIGIIQIGGAILAFFIPNEEYYEQAAEAAAAAQVQLQESTLEDSSNVQDAQAVFGSPKETVEAWQSGSGRSFGPLSEYGGPSEFSHVGMSPLDRYSGCHCPTSNYL